LRLSGRRSQIPRRQGAVTLLLLRDTINPGVSGIHPRGSSALLHESHYFAYNAVSAPSTRGCHETELSAAKRLEHDWIIEARPVRRNQGQLFVEQYDLPIPQEAAIKPGEARPRRISGEQWRLGFRRLCHRFPHGGHQLLRDIGRV
jgi:hypothetical protein